MDHSGDAQLHTWGDTLKEASEQCAVATFGYGTDTRTVEALQTIEVETKGDDLQSLFFHFWITGFVSLELVNFYTLGSEST